jgi:hypothetical protein
MVWRMTKGAEKVMEFCETALGVTSERVDVAHVLATTTARQNRDEWEDVMARGVFGSACPQSVDLTNAELVAAKGKTERFGAAILDRARMGWLWDAAVHELAARCILPQYFANDKAAKAAILAKHPRLADVAVQTKKQKKERKGREGPRENDVPRKRPEGPRA